MREPDTQSKRDKETQEASLEALNILKQVLLKIKDLNSAIQKQNNAETINTESLNDSLADRINPPQVS